MNIIRCFQVHVYINIFFWSINPEAELLLHRLMFRSTKKCQLVYWSGYFYFNIYSLQARHRNSLSLHSCQQYIRLICWYHCDLNLNSLIINEVENLFICLSFIFILFKSLYLLPILLSNYFFLIFKSIFSMGTNSSLVMYKYLLPGFSLPFHFL